MTSGTAVIKNSDMEIHMEKDVINLSSIAFQKFSVEKDIAAYIKKQLDKKSNRPALSLTSLNKPSAVPAAGDRRRSQGQRPLSVRQTVIP